MVQEGSGIHAKKASPCLDTCSFLSGLVEAAEGMHIGENQGLSATGQFNKNHFSPCVEASEQHPV